MPRGPPADPLLPLSAFPVGRRNKALRTRPPGWLPPGSQATKHQPTAGLCWSAGPHLQHKQMEWRSVQVPQCTKRGGAEWPQAPKTTVCSVRGFPPWGPSVLGSEQPEGTLSKCATDNKSEVDESLLGREALQRDLNKLEGWGIINGTKGQAEC